MRKVTRIKKRLGQSIGELCLLSDCPLPANCDSGLDAPVKLWQLNKTMFRQILALPRMKKDETLRNALKWVKHLEFLYGDYINQIVDALYVKEVPRGAVMYREGDATVQLYVIASVGIVKVPWTGGESIVLGQGKAFGEEALVPKKTSAPQA
ncbi:hypothetical protein ACHAW6_012293 [Cyclotella cf. meneghiniana]